MEKTVSATAEKLDDEFNRKVFITDVSTLGGEAVPSSHDDGTTFDSLTSKKMPSYPTSGYMVYTIGYPADPSLVPVQGSHGSLIYVGQTKSDLSRRNTLYHRPGGWTSPSNINIDHAADPIQLIYPNPQPIRDDSQLSDQLLLDDNNQAIDIYISSPFDHLDAENAEQAAELIERVLDLPRTDSRELHDRLQDLLEISTENSDQRVMSAQSLRFFIEFIERYCDFRSPLIFLLESGDIRSEWRVSERQALALEFTADGTVDYIAFSPNLRRPTITQIRSGDNLSWRDLIPALQQGSDVSWLWEPDG